VPLYYQLAEQLREQIDASIFPPGSQLPAERELSEQAGISRMTARQAIAYLARAGVVEVRQGVGTFVAAPKHTYAAVHLLGFTAEIMRQGGSTSSHVLEQATVAPPLRVAKGLALEADETVTKLVRLRFAGEIPLLQETIFIPTALCPDLVAADLQNQSLYALLDERYGLRLAHAQQMLEATVANDFEADLFGLDPGSAMILLEGITYARQDLPVEYFKAVYRGDRVRFEFESHRNGFDSQPSSDTARPSRLVPVIDSSTLRGA
jgi:GntR family transcriptional regulator